MSSGSYDDLSPVESECTADCEEFSAKCGEVTVTTDAIALVHGDLHYYVEPGDDRRCLRRGETDEHRVVTRNYDDSGPVCFGKTDPNGISEGGLD